MKPKFAYLYISFIISLVMLVVLSLLFYQRLNSHLRYSGDLERSYEVISQLKDLEKRMVELETSSRGYLLLKDSSLLDVYQNSREGIAAAMNSLVGLVKNDLAQTGRMRLMRSTVVYQTNIYNRNIEHAAEFTDSSSLRNAVASGKILMDTFRLESSQIEKAELQQRSALFDRKKFYENIFPDYFNTILIFAAVITLVSFFFINREVRIRAKYQVELERRLQELNRSNAELEQFAYVASHDLQEPLRKIRMFGDRLVYKQNEFLNAESRQTIEKMNASAHRLQELIQDMVNFTALIARGEKKDTVNLNKTIQEILVDFKEQIRLHNAVIHSDELPFLTVIPSQLTLLFKSLFDNAFKFSKSGESTVIHISYSRTEGIVERKNRNNEKKLYHRIVMKDNGIGFDDEFADKIFIIFQRLHTQQSGYRGKGIGLATAQRIMTNHNGLIMAKGMVNHGAAFIMYFPVEV